MLGVKNFDLGEVQKTSVVSDVHRVFFAYTAKYRDRIKRFGIANNESLFTCSESKTTLLNFFTNHK